MELSDIGPSCHQNRTNYYLNFMFGKGPHSKGFPATVTEDELHLANQLATSEMLDEIHFMLRTILNLPNKA